MYVRLTCQHRVNNVTATYMRHRRHLAATLKLHVSLVRATCQQHHSDVLAMSEISVSNINATFHHCQSNITATCQQRHIYILATSEQHAKTTKIEKIPIFKIFLSIALKIPQFGFNCFKIENLWL